MKPLLSIYILLLFAGITLHAQDESAETNFYDALFFMEKEEDFREARYLFNEVLKQEPYNAHVKYLLGRCYIQIRGQEEKAIPFLREATESITLKFRENKYREKRAPHHSWFYLAEAYSKTNQMEEALEALTRFRDLNNFEKKYNLRITEEAIAAVERAKMIQDAEVPIRGLFFNEPINSPQDDYNGVISGNGQVMVWANSKAFYEAIYMSVRENNQWSIPVLITPQVLSDGDLLPTGLSFNGDYLLMVKKGRKDDGDIYISHMESGQWSPAVPVEGDVNTNGNEDHASFSPDGAYIYFSSDRRGGQGGLDIWYAPWEGENRFGNAVNMGEDINTDKDETSAYIAPTGERFIFSSTGHFNMGGYDIFYCELEEGDQWSQPVNLGYPLNTTSDNTFYVPVNQGLQALYSRFTNEAIGGYDLWFVEVLDEGYITNDMTLAADKPSLSKKDFAIIVVDMDTGEEIEILYDSETDAFKALAGQNKKYKVISYKQE